MLFRPASLVQTDVLCVFLSSSSYENKHCVCVLIDDQSAQREGESATKKRRRIIEDLVDNSTQTECRSPLINLIPVALIKTTTVKPVDVTAILEKKSYQRSILHMHNLHLSKSDKSLLDDHGLLDPLVELLEKVDRQANQSHHQPINNQDSTESVAVQQKDGISETEEENDGEDDDDDDEDEDYVFESPSEDEDDDEHIQCDYCKYLKEYKKRNFVQVDASTQTSGDSTFAGLQTAITTAQSNL